MHPQYGLGVVALLAVSHVASADGLARSRIIYLTHDGVSLRPGADDSTTQTSSVVTSEVDIPPWTTTPEIWSDTVACVAEIYSRFSVTVTDVDPGDVPHIEGVFGGSPLTLGLPRATDGMSPFAGDCSVTENSVVFAFTEILAGDAQSACDVMAHEIGHAYGLDHELMASDPMSTQHQPAREFVDQDAACGESAARPCGLNGNMCRASQNSYQILSERLGLAGSTAPQSTEPDPAELGGCAATRGAGSATSMLVLAIGAMIRRRSRR